MKRKHHSTLNNPKRRRRSSSRRRSSGGGSIAAVGKSTLKNIMLPVAGFYAGNVISDIVKTKFFTGAPAAAAPATQGIGLNMNNVIAGAAGLAGVYFIEKFLVKKHGMFEGAAIGLAVGVISSMTAGTAIGKWTKLPSIGEDGMESEDVINGDDLIGADAQLIGADAQLIGEDDMDMDTGAMFDPTGYDGGDDDSISGGFSPVGE